jgi:hypothetical protein
MIIQEVLRRTICPLDFDMIWAAQKMAPPTILLCCGNVFTESLPSNGSGIHRQTHRLSFDKIWTAQKMASSAFLPLLHIFIVGGKVFTNPLPSDGKRGIHTNTQPEGRDL